MVHCCPVPGALFGAHHLRQKHLLSPVVPAAIYSTRTSGLTVRKNRCCLCLPVLLKGPG